jgi:hypothetical protein
MLKAAKLLLASQIVLAVSVVVCTIILPQFLFSRDQGGMSNYGVNSETIIPFTIGFAGAGILICYAAWVLPQKTAHFKSLRFTLWLIGLLCLVLVATTYAYKLNHVLDLVHVYSAQFLALVEAVVGVWYARRLVKDRKNQILLGIFWFGFALGLLTVGGVLHVLFVAEALTAFSFGAIMVHTVYALTNQKG